MICALLSFAIQAADPIQIGSVEIGGRAVTVTVPSQRGPFGPDTPHTVRDGFKFDNATNVRYRVDGGWGEVADLYPSAAQKAASAPEFKIKVFILENTLLLHQAEDGVWRERTGSLSPAQKEEIYGSLARLKAMAETATDGAVRLTFDVTTDVDLVFRTASGPTVPVHRGVTRIDPSRRPDVGGLLGPGFVYDEIGPRVNNDAFETEDGKYRGPYSGVFVLHGTPVPEVATYVLDRTPTTVVSLSTFGTRDMGTALSIQLFNAWLQHLGLAADAALRGPASRHELPVGDSLPKFPQVFHVPVTPEALARGNRLSSRGFGESATVGFQGRTESVSLPVWEDGSVPEEVRWLASLSGQLSEEGLVRARNALRSRDLVVRMNALAAFSRVKEERLVDDMGALTTSAFPGEVFLAVQALVFQGVDRAWAQIASAAVRGPFGANYMFAAEALGNKTEDITLEVLGVPLLSLSWHARLAAIHSVNRLDSEHAGVVASATLGSPEPDSAVRFAIVSKQRPNSELFARRVLFAAVNDDSEWVRTRSYLALIDSEFTEIRDQAIRGVRDEGVGVRLALLAAMKDAPKEHYRAALRLAVVDQEPLVRAAALRAFAAQPGEVLIAEVQNTLSDRNPHVRAALEGLAKAKGLQIPPQ